MTNPREAPESTPSPNVPASSSEPTQPSVTVELPIDLVNAIQQHICQTGYQTGQTPTQAVLDVLRSALNQPPDPNPSVALTRPLSTDLIAELHRLHARVTQLEALIPKVADLEGKSIAF